MIGTFLLWALVYLYFLPIYNPLESVGPQKPCVTPLRGSRRRRGGGQLLLPGLLPGWLGWPYQTPLIPPLASLSGEQLQALSVGLGRKTVIRLLAATFLVSEGCIGCLP